MCETTSNTPAWHAGRVPSPASQPALLVLRWPKPGRHTRTAALKVSRARCALAFQPVSQHPKLALFQDNFFLKALNASQIAARKIILKQALFNVPQTNPNDGFASFYPPRFPFCYLQLYRGILLAALACPGERLQGVGRAAFTHFGAR